MAEVVNIVASMRMTNSIDVNAVADELEIDYEQEQFPGMVYRVENPKVCLLLFRSGKAVATGAKDVESVDIAFKRLREDLEKNNFDLWDEKDCEVHLHNIVMTSDLSEIVAGKIDLSNLMLHLPFDKTEYEPEQFPGLIYRLDDPAVVFLIFSSGRCVITGANQFEDAERAESVLRDELASFLND
jgi:transcription initiation factor TFIID TATA-box-binding protein